MAVLKVIGWTLASPIIAIAFIITGIGAASPSYQAQQRRLRQPHP